MLDDSFRGIEKFYTDRLIDLAEKAKPNTLAKKANGVRVVPKKEYEAIKKVLYEEILNNGLQSADLQYAKPFLSEVLTKLKEIISSTATATATAEDTNPPGPEVLIVER